MTKTPFPLAFFTLLTLSCGGGNPQESEAEGEAEADGEEKSVGDCNLYSFSETWSGTFWQNGCMEDQDSPTFEQCCPCRTNKCTTTWEMEITATITHGELTWGKDEYGKPQILADATLEINTPVGNMACRGSYGCSRADVFCTDDRAVCLKEGTIQDPPISQEMCEKAYTQCMELLPGNYSFVFDDCQLPSGYPFLGERAYLEIGTWKTLSINILYGDVIRSLCMGNPNFGITLNREP